MAVYKVPQDVEADDKLIGPFSFRQFIYLIVVAIAGFLAYILSQILLPLFILPLPIMIFFGAIALPLRKDQPMELYLLALVQFYLKPKQRKWEPEGTVVTVEITAPKVAEPQRTKGFSGDEASSRLDYLAQIMDSRGWSARSVDAVQPIIDPSASAPEPTSTKKYEPQEEPDDILDDGTPVAQKFEEKIEKQETEYRQGITEKISTETKELDKSDELATKSHKKTTKPAHKTTKKKTKKAHSQKASVKAIPPDIINLAYNTDFSVETVAREAKRINKREGRIEDEVTILIPHTKH